MSQRKSKNKVVVIDQDLLKSRAWISLTGAAPLVYGLFLTKRQFEKIKVKGQKKFVHSNNGELIFTYGEAEKKYSLTQPRFLRAIDQLVEHGFLDIAEPGKAVARLPTKYSLSERWRQYGTVNFQETKRTHVEVGFCKTKHTKT